MSLRTLSFAALAALSLLVAAPVAHASVKAGDRFVELDGAKTADGKTFTLKTMTGRWVIYSFGASWCAPCHKELPAWDKLAPRYANKALFVAVNINNDAGEGKAFVRSLGLEHMLAVYLPADSSKALTQYDPDHMPSTFVIDPDGVVRFVAYGYTKGDEGKLASKLDGLVK